MENFHSLGLPEALLNRLEAIQYTTPTPIQAQTIPHALQSLDVLGTAQTGTGKTAAYVIPLVYHLLNSSDKAALVLTPTREIAIQVTNFLEKLLDRSFGIKTALIIGGDSMGNQLNQLRMKPRIIVGTPGRINDHLDRGTLKLDQSSFVVLDETDRMLDMGFSIQLDEIFKFLPHNRQTLMFSATLPQNIQKVANRYLKDPVRITVGSTVAAADTITQEVIHTSEDKKYDVLLEQLELKTGSIIIFVKTKFNTEKLAKRLSDHGHSVDAIHGDLRQRSREKVMRCFRSKKNRILVATDIAARGLDIAHVECVINHDLPQCEEDFIHRIGRTGRAGAEGTAISLITPQDHIKWRNINKMMNPNVKFELGVEEVKSSSRGGKSRGGNDRFKRSSNNDFPYKAKRPSEDGYRKNVGSDDGANRFGRSSRSDNGPSRPSNGMNRSDNGANRFSGAPRSDDGANRFGRSERSDGSSRPSNGANRFSGAQRSDDGANRFGRSDRSDSSSRPSNGANRFSGAQRSGDGANRFGRSDRSDSSSRPSNGANRFSGAQRSDDGANRFGRSDRSDSSSRPSNGANRFGGAQRSDDGANRFGRSNRSDSPSRPSNSVRSDDGANRFGRSNRSDSGSSKFGRSPNNRSEGGANRSEGGANRFSNTNRPGNGANRPNKSFKRAGSSS